MQRSFVILTAFLIASVSASSLTRRDDTIPPVQVCTEFDTRDKTDARCDANPAVKCTTGCTGSISGVNCTLSPSNVTGDSGATPAPMASVACTKSWGKSSATSYVCNTDNASYTCTSAGGGNVTCSGCVRTGVQIGNVSATTPPGNNTGEPSTGHGGSSPNGAQGFASVSMFSACVAALVAGVASIVV
ncbi:hypothetical protein CROQUDRAFT_715291 [Cronartium quercuum f. sp. fusiforme G11]|uniref:Uncharacterized protein n=1 Tax=Cronartium quercuum f. sp. fusiforme G11 TaxID=708437 RepID=A0A9P6TC70_9BASI|nr:hypothetical protein CROQUDRAFT_715291 [Cronartium quercuum f. sp. fusiforme G11]